MSKEQQINRLALIVKSMSKKVNLANPKSINDYISAKRKLDELKKKENIWK